MCSLAMQHTHVVPPALTFAVLCWLVLQRLLLLSYGLCMLFAGDL